MKLRPRPDPARRGYISLLAMSFTLGLAILAGGLTTGVQNYFRVTARQERALRTTIGLESAANEVLGRMAAGGAIELGVASHSDVTIEVSPTWSKVDLGADPEALIEKRLDDLGLAIAPSAWRAAAGLADLSAAASLSGGQEDCLRRAFTYGRGGAPAVAVEALPRPWTARAGDQLDIRVASKDASSVVWIRARFTGREGGWLLQDFRRLAGSCPGR